MHDVVTVAGLGWPMKPLAAARGLGWPTGPLSTDRPPVSLVSTMSGARESRPTDVEVSRETSTTAAAAPRTVDGDRSVDGDSFVTPPSAPSRPIDVSRETVSRFTDPLPGQPGGHDDTDSWHVRGEGREPSSLVGAGDVSRETVDVGESVEQALLHATAGVDEDDTPLAAAIAVDTRRRLVLTGRPLPKPTHTRILTVANQKGGVGKTTTAVNIAAALAQSGLRVLVIDLDPQGNASTALGIDHRAGVPSIYEVLVGELTLAEVVAESSTVAGLFCAPATIDLAGAEIELVSLVAREGRLRKALEAHLGQTAYDYVFIDCPPSLGLLTVNAFVASREVFIPIQCEYYALEGLSQLLRSIELIRTHLNPTLAVSTILLTMHDGRTRLSAQVAEEVREHFPEQTLRTTIPRSVRVSEAPSFGETVMTYDPLNSAALAYLEAAGQLAEQGTTTDPAEHGTKDSR